MSSERRVIRRKIDTEPSTTDPSTAVASNPEPTPVKEIAPVQPATQFAPARKLAMDDLESIASMNMDDLAALMDAETGRKSCETGDRVQGLVTGIGKENVLVDIGAKSEGLIAREQLPDVTIGETVSAFVISSDESGIHLSCKLTGQIASQFIDEAYDAKIPIEGVVSGQNPGGYDVKIGSVRAFCPVSQMDRRASATPEEYIGQTFSFLVVEAGDNVVVSRRALLETGMEELREAFWSQVDVDQTYTSIVVSCQPFGVFVEIDGVQGLVPKRELSWSDGTDPMSIPQGTSLEVRVIDVNHDKHKLTFSAKDPSYSPWSQLGSDFTPGQVVNGKIVRLTEFGAFIELAPGLDGLLHRSRLKGKTPELSETVSVRILSMDKENHRIELAFEDDEGATSSAETAVDTMVKGTVTAVLKNGLKLDCEDGSMGWISAREVELPPNTILSQRFRVGKEVEARVVSESEGGRKKNLSLRLEDSQDKQWRGSAKSAGSATFGTMADLLSGVTLKN